ncbi:MAG: hypothetical protein IJ831_07080 [Spirochaetales bacterium]|nr:hypothetical protein [Spirochaetales bacterium]
MKKSTMITMILSIVSLVLSFIFKALAILSGFQRVHYSGWGYSYTEIVVRQSAAGQILSAFSQMTFILGIVLICVFAYLAVKNPSLVQEKKEETKREEEPKACGAAEPKDGEKSQEMQGDALLVDKEGTKTLNS